MPKRFVILDGSSLIYRAFYAMPPLTDARGESTGAIVGFSNMLTKLMQELTPDFLGIAFDKSRHTFRTERYAEYKGTRDKTPQELLEQLPLLREFAVAHGIAFLEKENYEADDIIGTLATQAASQGYEALIITGDRDALQLIRPNLRVLLTKKGITDIKEYDEAAFQEEYGFEPLRLIDLKGLMGDSSDNIPGVPGVGPKTAKKLLLEYGHLEDVLAHAEEVSGKKLKENLITNKEQALLSKELATIELAVPGVSFAENDFILRPDAEKMQAFCERYELRGVWKNFQKVLGEPDAVLTAPTAEAVLPNLDYEILEGALEAQAVLTGGQIAAAGLFTGEAPFAKLTGLALACGGKLYFVSADAEAWTVAVSALEQGKPAVLYELKRYYQAGFKPGKDYFDVQLADYLLQPERSTYELAALSKAYLQGELVPEGFADAQEHAVWEARLLGKLQPLLLSELQAQHMEKLYQEIELPLVEVLADMEQQGVYVNRAELGTKAQEVGERITGLEQQIYELAKHEFKINSPKQLGTVLFDELGLPAQKKTKTGYSTNAEVLESLRFRHPIVEQVLSYRMWTKLKSTYLDGIAGLIRPDSGRVHTNFNQTVTATGRLSSSDPNLQNIPVRTEEGKTIRALFEPGAGYDWLLSADYSQIELRILAHMSGDENFLDAFRQGQDVHARTAAEVFGVSLGEVTPDMRRKAKAVNFGIVYGISDFGLARDLHIPRQEAAGYIKLYFERYPGVKSFLDGTVAEARKQGFVQTLFGRRRNLPGLNERNFNLRSLAERMAMNTPIQGTAADIIKLAMIEAYKRLQAMRLKSRILLQVHDELVLEVVEAEREQVTALLKDAMENIAELAVPLVIDVHYGRNWSEAK